MIDIKDLNKITETDNYLMFLQLNVISVVINFFYIFTMNEIDYFHQFFVKIINRHKLTIVSHKEQE